MALQERIEKHFKNHYEMRGICLFFTKPDCEKVEFMTSEEMKALSYKEFCERFMKSVLKTTWFWRKDDGIAWDSEVLTSGWSACDRQYEPCYRVGYIRPLIKAYVKSL